jgi:hypothetical protein
MSFLGPKSGRRTKGSRICVLRMDGSKKARLQDTTCEKPVIQLKFEARRIADLTLSCAMLGPRGSIPVFQGLNDD